MTAFLRSPRYPRPPVLTGLTLAREERGAAIVEMALALALPLLLALLMGMLVYGQYFMLAHGVQQAANDARQALLTALEAQGEIGHARISVREAVEAANDALLEMLGVDVAAIRRVSFSALLAIGYRAGFADGLEELFRSGQPVRLASQIVTRDGDAIDVTLTIAEVRGPFASDGAVVLVTQRPA
ncbi:hypothetical protein CDQ92_13470 [Sphingopyxis bauzanensis]|uniref:TadE-like domain-containing protein n=1 Tax=Sphingopyxis bauzanensis TaxID=651663 RepID=A0A246JRW9_9SPHN|nr:PAS domain-containing protein [Sphingopyxis bauzanensis]OWQ95781.1 hypothetical protein CDQ92_13470 [Sphingopyxis bauzanensis]